jgi:hypothetical protein
VGCTVEEEAFRLAQALPTRLFGLLEEHVGATRFPQAKSSWWRPQSQQT